MENLFLLVLSMLALDCFHSIRFAWHHLISRFTSKSLNSFYYTLEHSAFDHSRWLLVSAQHSLSGHSIGIPYGVNDDKKTNRFWQQNWCAPLWQYSLLDSRLFYFVTAGILKGRCCLLWMNFLSWKWFAMYAAIRPFMISRLHGQENGVDLATVRNGWIFILSN